MPIEEEKKYKVAAALTEEEMMTLSEVLWPSGAMKAEDSREETAKAVWKKLVVTAEIKYGREFDRKSPSATPVTAESEA